MSVFAEYTLVILDRHQLRRNTDIQNQLVMCSRGSGRGWLHLLSVPRVIRIMYKSVVYFFFLRSIVESNVVIYAVWSEHDL